MGSWSVACGISKIAITAGQQCVLLPLHKMKYQEWHYFTHNPATCAIFGTYNDYGGIEDIVEDENTKMIEEHFKISIQEFCDYFTEETTYQRDEWDAAKDKVQNFDEMKDWKFMWIDRKVYDFLSKNIIEKNYQMGNPEFLKLLGFEEDGFTDDKRFYHKFTFGDFSLGSDGEWAQGLKGESLHYLSKGWGGLYNHITLPEDKKWIEKLCFTQLWEHLSDSTAKKLLIPSITGSNYNDTFDFLGSIGREERVEGYIEEALPLMAEYLKNETKFEDIKVEYEEKMNVLKEKYPIKPITLEKRYIQNFRKVGNLLCDLAMIGNCLHPMSSTFEPYILYLTPQCGERVAHQKMMKEFSKINQSYIKQN